MPVPPVPALRETLNAGDVGHIADHEAIAEALNNDTASLTADQVLSGANTFTDKTITSNVALRPPDPNNAILFVTPEGSDANDGLSWGSAKLTIQAALDDLPVYAGGAGGGSVFPSAGTFPDPITLTSGQYVKGAGRRSTLISGNTNAPMVSSATDGGSDPLNVYGGLLDLFIINANAGANARAAYLQQFANISLERVQCQAVPAGAAIAQLRAVITSKIDDCGFGGAAGADVGLLLEAANNNIVVERSNFTDAKAGLVSLGGNNLDVNENHFETLAGGAARNAAIWIDGTNGGEVMGNYVETVVGSFLTLGTGISGATYGFTVGGNFATNCGSPFIDAVGARFCDFLPNIFIPGAISPNANGLLVGAAAQNCRVGMQYLASGSGAALSVNAAALKILVEDAVSRYVRGAAATTSTIMAAFIAGEASARWQRDAAGKDQWGPGSGAYDTDWQRTGVGRLVSGQKIGATGGLMVGNSAAATTPGSVVKKIEIFDTAGASLGFIPVYSAIT